MVPKLEMGEVHSKVAGVQSARDAFAKKIVDELNNLMSQSARTTNESVMKMPSDRRASAIPLNCMDTLRDSYDFIEHEDWIDKVFNVSKQQMVAARQMDPEILKQIQLARTNDVASELAVSTARSKLGSQYVQAIEVDLKDLNTPAKILSTREVRDYRTNNPELLPQYGPLQSKGRIEIET